jgi:autotransporter-associated beta strand protein
MTKQINQWTALLGMALMMTGMPALATDYYWDTNGAAAGSGPATGEWGTDAFWSTDATGGSATTAAAITNADNVFFSAGANGTAGTVTVEGNRTVSTFTINQSGLTFTGGTISGTFAVNASATINSYVNIAVLNFVTTDNQSLTLGGGGVITAPGFHAYGAKGSTSSLILDSGAYTFNGGYLNIGNPNTGVGGLVVNGGTLTSANLTWLGYGGNSIATLNGGVWNNPGGMVIGRGNTGKLIVNSGTLNVTGANSLSVGWNGKGSMDVTGGVVNVDQLSIGANTKGVNETGTMTISGSGVVNGGTVNFGWGYGGPGVSGDGRYTSNAGNGTLLLKGGRLNVGGGGLILTGTGTYTANIILSGGTLGTTGVAWNSDMNMTLGNADGGVTIDADQNITLNGVLDGDGGLTKTGAGTLLLSGANTYAGDTIVNAGVLELGNAAALGLAADLSLLNGVTVDLNYTGNATIDHLLLDGVIIDNLTINTAYNATDLNAALDSIIFSGNGLLIISAIPEPSALALLGFGIIGVLVLRRRKA